MTDPQLELIEFIKPNGTPIMVNSFSASLTAAIDNGWLPKKEYIAAKIKATKAKNKKRK